MVSPSTLQELIELRDAYNGCPLELRRDLVFIHCLDNVISYIKEGDKREQDDS